MKLRVGVLRGGPSDEYEESLQSGENVLSILREELGDKYEPLDIFIDRAGAWHMYGKPITIADLQKNVDVIWNALHGHFGEDGQAQRLLEQTGIPFTGSGALATAQTLNKMTSRDILQNAGIKVPTYMVISSLKKINENLVEKGMKEMTEGYYVEDVTKKIFQSFAPYWILKPKMNKNSDNVYLVKTLSALSDAVQKSINHGDDIIVEEYIHGINATSFNIENFRNNEIYATIPFDTQRDEIHKRIDSYTTQKIHEISSQVHRILNLSHYSQVDFLIHKNGLLYVVDIRALPQLNKESNLNKVLNSHGSKFSEFVENILSKFA